MADLLMANTVKNTARWGGLIVGIALLALGILCFVKMCKWKKLETDAPEMINPALNKTNSTLL